jgi:predicted regulator of Ras-like GTPase activity (Roadblock/LC7/MglB family)
MAGDSGRSLEQVLTPYLEISGVNTAALVSSDGLPVASAGGAGVNLEALAVRAAILAAATAELSSELGGRPRILALDNDGMGVILAPLTSDLLLVIVGAKKILGLIRQ